ncbi:hypothetical protein D3C80_2021190 [compost metagenome]
MHQQDRAFVGDDRFERVHLNYSVMEPFTDLHMSAIDYFRYIIYIIGGAGQSPLAGMIRYAERRVDKNQ